MLAYSASDHLQLMRKYLYHWNVHIYSLLLLLSSSLLYGWYTLKWNVQLNGEKAERWRDADEAASSQRPFNSVWNKYIHLCVADQRAMLARNVEDVRGNHFSASQERDTAASAASWTDKLQIPKAILRRCMCSRWRASASASVVIFIVPIKRLFYLRTTTKKLCFFHPRLLLLPHAIRSYDFVFTVHLFMGIIIITIWLHTSTSFRGERDYLRCVYELPGSNLFGQQRKMREKQTSRTRNAHHRNLIQSVSNYDFLYIVPFQFVRACFALTSSAPLKIYMQNRWSLFYFYRSPQLLGSTNCEFGSQLLLLLSLFVHSANALRLFCNERTGNNIIIARYWFLYAFINDKITQMFSNADVLSASEPNPLGRCKFILMLFFCANDRRYFWLREPFSFSAFRYSIESNRKDDGVDTSTIFRTLINSIFFDRSMFVALGV